MDITEILDVEVQPGGLAGFDLRLRGVRCPYVKDYDSLDGGPHNWAQRFDLSKWALLAAYIDDQRVGGAAVAIDAPDLVMLEGRGDLAVLWDIRLLATRPANCRDTKRAA